MTDCIFAEDGGALGTDARLLAGGSSILDEYGCVLVEDGILLAADGGARRTESGIRDSPTAVFGPESDV